MYVFDNISLNSTYNEKRLRQSCRKHQNTHFMVNNFFSRKSCRLWDNVEKYSRARQATDYNIIRRRKYARIQIYTSIFNTHSFFMATVLKGTRLNVKLYVHCQSCFFTIPTYVIYIPPYVENQGDEIWNVVCLGHSTRRSEVMLIIHLI
jgi:hypothetical protein